MQLVGTLAVAAVAFVSAPREQVWREGTCVFVESDVRYVRDAALPQEGYRLDITPGDPPQAAHIAWRQLRPTLMMNSRVEVEKCRISLHIYTSTRLKPDRAVE